MGSWALSQVTDLAARRYYVLLVMLCHNLQNSGRRLLPIAAKSVTCDNAQLPMLSEPCSCWPVAASVGGGY